MSPEPFRGVTSTRLAFEQAGYPVGKRRIGTYVTKGWRVLRAGRGAKR